MGDAVVRVRGHLQNLARENWTAIEAQHACNVSWLQSELAQISRSLEVKVRFEPKPPVTPAPYPSALEDTFRANEPANKKQKVEMQREEPALLSKDQRRRSARLSMRLRTRKASVDVTRDEKKTRKRARPSKGPLQDPAKLKVVELRSELKRRGLRTGGLKNALLNRLLNALEQEKRQNERQGPEETREIVVIDDDDEIVRESVGSFKSLRSQSTSPKATSHDDEKDLAKRGKDEETPVVPVIESDKGSGEIHNKEPSKPAEKALAPALQLREMRQHSVSIERNKENGAQSSRRDFEEATVERVLTKNVETCDDREPRKSMQVIERDLARSIAWKRKSILRKTTSLAPRNTRKVSFAPKNMVNVIVESSQTDSSQPDPSPDDTPLLVDKVEAPAVNKEKKQETRSDSVTEDDNKVIMVNTPSATREVPTTREISSFPVVSKQETDEQRRKREFDESVQREAQKLRAAAKLSAQKRLEEAKASKAFWAKRDQLKAKLRASSTSDKGKSTSAPVASIEKTADTVSPSTSIITDITSSTVGDRTSLALKKEKLTQSTAAMTRKSLEKATEYDSMRCLQEVGSTSGVPVSVESSRHEDKGLRSTYSTVEDKYHVERLQSVRPAEKPAAKSMPSTIQITQDSLPHAGIEVASRQELYRLTQESLVSAPFKGVGSEKNSELQTANSFQKWNRPESLSSTVSSIPEPSLVENALKSGTAPALSIPHRPNLHLSKDLHSFSSILDKDNSQQSNSSRLAPVVNALKLAERSRVAEEKKRLEKVKRKAMLKKRMEEHKQAVALKEKAEKDAQEKREQDRLNERKKREAELAKRRQQKLKEMRAGLEKKRAMLAAEKKSRIASSAAMPQKSVASIAVASHSKHRGLASASEVSQPMTKPTSKPLQKAISKPVLKPHSRPDSSQSIPAVGRPASKPVSKVVYKPLQGSPVPGKQAPKSHSPEVLNYEMSDNAESSDGGSSDSDAGRRGKKKVPKWAQRDHLSKILHAQFGRNAIDPSPTIFQDFANTCNLEAIFETTDIQKKKKFARRTSSGNWLADRPTARDKALYQHDMGYDQ